MMHFKSSLFTLALIASSILTASAQANSLKKITFEINRFNTAIVGGYQSKVRLIGDNIDVTAEVWQQTAPQVCQPICFRDTPIRFGSPLDNNGFKNASGTIDGIFYPTLYIFHGLQYTNPETRIPVGWTKSVMTSAPLTLTGYVGIWRTEQEVGDYSRALYLHQGINFPGRVRLILRVGRDGDSTRYYRDKYLGFDFEAGNSSLTAPANKASAKK